MTVYDKARELGEAILNTEVFSKLKEAEIQLNNDKEALGLMNKNDDIMNQYLEAIKVKEDNDKITSLKKELERLQHEISTNKVIQYYNLCNSEYNRLISNIDSIIDFITGNEAKQKKCNGCNGCGK